MQIPSFYRQRQHKAAYVEEDIFMAVCGRRSSNVQLREQRKEQNGQERSHCNGQTFRNPPDRNPGSSRQYGIGIIIQPLRMEEQQDAQKRTGAQ